MSHALMIQIPLYLKALVADVHPNSITNAELPALRASLPVEFVMGLVKRYPHLYCLAPLLLFVGLTYCCAAL